MNIVAFSIPFFILGMLIEYRFGRQYYRLNDTISNLSAGLIQQSLGFLPAMIIVLAYPWLLENFSLRIFSGQFGLWTYVLSFLFADFIYYWAHRIFHRTGMGWTGHVVHHQSEEYNLSVALRQSWLQGLHGIPFVLVPAILGFEMSVFLTSNAINVVYQFWIHTRLIKHCPRWFEAVFNTPSHHRVHHGRNPAYIDKNYAGALIIWDKMFGTFTPETDEVVYGVTEPTRTWNPITAQMATLGRLFKKGPGKDIGTKLRYWVHPPGWTETEGELAPIYEVREKFNPEVSMKLKAWAIGIFLLALAVFVYALIHRGQMAFYEKCLWALGVIMILYQAGKILDPSSKEKS